MSAPDSINDNEQSAYGEGSKLVKKKRQQSDRDDLLVVRMLRNAILKTQTIWECTLGGDCDTLCVVNLLE